MFEQAHSFIRGFFKACEVKEMPKDKTFLSESHYRRVYFPLWCVNCKTEHENEPSDINRSNPKTGLLLKDNETLKHIF